MEGITKYNGEWKYTGHDVIYISISEKRSQKTEGRPKDTPSKEVADRRPWRATETKGKKIKEDVVASASAETKRSEHVVVLVNCAYILEGDFIVMENGESFHVETEMTCQTSNVVYAIFCQGCEKSYIGETTIKGWDGKAPKYNIPW